jgi:hypothetical protein
VLSPSLLVRRHHDYHFRIMMGPNYRADMWAALESDASLSAATLARETYGSFASAWHVRRDFLLLRGAPVGELLQSPRRNLRRRYRMPFAGRGGPR